jgi:hypothetical protein
VGDIDILAVDPKSDIRIGVTCKNWETNPESKDFNHFVSMLELEDLTHGVIAWVHVPSSVYPLREKAAKKGYQFAIIDKTKYEELHHWMLTGQRGNIETFFRSELNLQSTKTPTLGQELTLRKKTSRGRTIDCTNLLPLEQGLDPPKYIRNAYFEPTEANLSVRPFLLAKFYVQKDAKIPRTGETQQSINREVSMLVDAINGKYANENSPLFHLVTTRWTDAIKHYAIEEEGFVADIQEPKINKQEMTHKMRIDLARSIEPMEVTWTEYRGEEKIGRSKIVEVTPSDIRELSSVIVNVPLWEVTYKLVAYNYHRSFFATDGSVMKDEMAECMICKEPTVAVCKSCGSVVCEDHTRTCKTCEELFCDNDAIQCANCKSMFCKPHAKGERCVTCEAFVCAADDARCVACKKTVCSEHTISCIQCGKTVCKDHQVEVRYMAVKNRFCSDPCHSKYDAEYRQKGMLGKLGKAVKRK